ncbi:MAG: ABC transporter ATP-binding protein/permease [Acidobacteriia bacterium]|nr:ABC transporter ATP-binding protein/permease [Terriglobia bacterium]
MKPQYSDGAILKRMTLEARPYWLHILAIFLLSVLSAPVALLAPLPLKIVIDNFIGARPLTGLVAFLVPNSLQHSGPALLAFAVGMLIAIAILTYVQGSGTWLLQTYAGEGMVLNFRAKLFAHVQRLSLAYHDTRGMSDSSFRIECDAPSIQFITVNGIIPLIASLATLVGLIFVTARLDRELALVAVGVSPVLFLWTHIFRDRLRKRWADVKELESSANAIVQEVLASMRVVKAFGREEHEQARFLHRSRRRMRELLRVSFLQGGFDLLIGTTIGVGTAATLYIGVVHVRSGALSLGDLTLTIAYVAQLFEPLKNVSKKLAELQGAMASAERAFAILDEVPDVTERPRARPVVRARGDVRFENVWFSYGRNPVFEGLDFEVPAGARVGIQGRTGAGKSTLMSLLTRLYDVNDGRILLDGVDLRDYKAADLRNQFAIVLQDSVLFSCSIAENVAYGRAGATEEQIIEAAKLANAHEFISNLPEGYDTLVGERGMQLSGGERQRISLARAFLKDAPILILDEPTSAMDTYTESLVMDAFERLMRGRTTFMIAHRLSTLELCDVRVELSGGELMEMCGAGRLTG